MTHPPFMVVEYYDEAGAEVGRQVIHGEPGDLPATLMESDGRPPAAAVFYRMVADFKRVGET